MSRAVCVSIMSVGCGVFYMRGVDSNSSGFLLWSIVNVLILLVVSSTGITEHWGGSQKNHTSEKLRSEKLYFKQKVEKLLITNMWLAVVHLGSLNKTLKKSLLSQGL